MHEKPPSVEGDAEIIPTSEEIRNVFEQLLQVKDYTETQKLEDENGLYLFNIELPDESGEGFIEYSYRRGRSSEGELEGLRVDVAFYDSNRVAVGGTRAALCENGVWRATR